MCGENGSIRDLEHVVWEVALGILAQLVHVKLRAQNVWTIEPARIEERAVASLAALAAQSQQTQW